MTQDTTLVVTNQSLAEQIVDDGVRRYFEERRKRIQPFVDRNFSLRGSLSLHRAAVGWDIAKAPLNLAMAAPQSAHAAQPTHLRSAPA